MTDWRYDASWLVFQDGTPWIHPKTSTERTDAGMRLTCGRTGLTVEVPHAHPLLTYQKEAS
jgi:hypothetical protein